MRKLHNTLLSLADITMRFGEIKRLTKHPTGRLESDSTHTVMLSIICLSISSYYCIPVDDGLVSQLCTVHDLHEAFCGDTSTLRIQSDKSALIEKSIREGGAYSRLLEMFPDSWLHKMLTLYNANVIPESRFVRAVDKLVPKLTHVLNNCQVLKEQKMTRQEFHNQITVSQYKNMEEYASDFPQVLNLHNWFAAEIEEMLPDEYITLC